MSKQSSVLFSPQEIAGLLHHDAQQKLSPSDQQCSIITAPLDGAYLVIAGAGSGKTETISQRIVWLIANNFVAADKILGLTFTNKAAGELAERLRERISKFITAAVNSSELNGQQKKRVKELQQQMQDGFSEPEVYTYNSFAAGIVAEFGVEQDTTGAAKILDDASAMLLALEVAYGETANHPLLQEREYQSVAQAIIALENVIVDNHTTVEKVAETIQHYLKIREMDQGTKARSDVISTIAGALESIEQTAALLPAVAEFGRLKKERGFSQFSDQVADAYKLVCSPNNTAKQTVGERYSVIFLDEVQDTSAGQCALLSYLFKGKNVMGVGDPQQTIYAWRGAAADNLRNFISNFSDKPQINQVERTLQLTTSYRNSAKILEVANRIVFPECSEATPCIAEPEGLHKVNTVSADTPLCRVCSEKALALELSGGKPLTVEPLQPAKSDTKDDATAPVKVQVAETIYDEAQWIATEIALLRSLDDKETPPSTAIIMRSREHMSVFEKALKDKNIPVRVIGAGGLLSTPEVAEVLSVLRVVCNLDAANALIRVLSGPRFAIAVRDIAQLSKIARALSKADKPEPADQVLPHPEKTVSIAEVLDMFTAQQPKDFYQGISQIGRERLAEAAHMFKRLRQLDSSDIITLLHRIEKELRLDIELAAHPQRQAAEKNYGVQPRANLERLYHEIANYLRINPDAESTQVLIWLTQAEKLDVFGGEQEPLDSKHDSSVQIITAHSAKGLEWDAVFVPQLQDGTLPNIKGSNGWFSFGELPANLRQDADYIPQAAHPEQTASMSLLGETPSQKMFEQTFLGCRGTKARPCASCGGEKNTVGCWGYKGRLKWLQALDERRVAYVAFTRARKYLYLSTCLWNPKVVNKKPLSCYLEELSAAGLIAIEAFESLIAESGQTTNPLLERDDNPSWPLDPLGSRTKNFRLAQRAVNEQLHLLSSGDDILQQEHVEPAPLSQIQQLLLAERQQKQESEKVNIAAIVNASAFGSFIENPEDFLVQQRRPIPQKPYRGSEIGNRFHEWVQQRFLANLATQQTIATLEHEPQKLETASVEYGEKSAMVMAKLQKNFNTSRWAKKQPVDVETQINMQFAGIIMPCKMDAVFKHQTVGAAGAETIFEIVDWKTGKAPQNAEQVAEKFFQLQLYRHAYARHYNLPLTQVTATLFYVATNTIFSLDDLPADKLYSFEQLEELYRQALAQAAVTTM